jgi:hypothetical protein
MQAVANNELPLIYMRFINDNNGARVNVEVVYDIRLRADLQYNQEPALPDKMAVFHFHVDGFFDDYPAVVAFGVFHAQQTYVTNVAGINEDRAYGFGTGANGLNQRTVIFSSENSNDPNARWYPGDPGSGEFMIDKFGITLREQGVMRGDAFATI